MDHQLFAEETLLHICNFIILTASVFAPAALLLCAPLSTASSATSRKNAKNQSSKVHIQHIHAASSKRSLLSEINVFTENVRIDPTRACADFRKRHKASVSAGIPSIATFVPPVQAQHLREISKRNIRTCSKCPRPVLLKASPPSN